MAYTLYITALRVATKITAMPTILSPTRVAKKKRSSLFIGDSALPAEGSPAPTSEADDTYDPVMEEVKRWERLPIERYETFYDNEGRESTLTIKPVIPTCNSSSQFQLCDPSLRQ